jgi:hypothetical protein
MRHQDAALITASPRPGSRRHPGVVAHNTWQAGLGDQPRAFSATKARDVTIRRPIEVVKRLNDHVRGAIWPAMAVLPVPVDAASR